MTEYADTHAGHLRLTILRLLAYQGGGYAANESVLSDGVNAMGFRVGRDRVKTAIAWLAEQGLVAVEEVEHMSVAILSQRGLDAAEGRIVVPGVKRPAPRG